MKSEKYLYFRVQWSARKEDVEACARRAYLTLDLVDEFLNSRIEWQQTFLNKSYRSKPKPVSTKSELELIRVLQAGRQYKDEPRQEIIEQLGWSLWLRNDADAINFHCHCGAYGDRVGNDVYISFDWQLIEEVDKGNLAKFLKGMIYIWDADFGVMYSDHGIMSPEHRTYIRFSKPQFHFHRGFPVLKNLKGQWANGRVWTDDEFSNSLSTWQLEPTKPISAMEWLRLWWRHA